MVTVQNLSPRSQAAWDEFRERVAQLGGEVVEPRWLGTNVPHRVDCSNGHDCAPRPADVRRGHGVCRVCVGKDPQASWAAFRLRVEELGGEVLEPAWLGSITPHRVRCADGHENRPTPVNVQKWGICRTCAGNDTRVAEAAFRTRLAEVGATLLELKWLGAKTPHRTRCAQGHECRPRPHGVLQGEGICRVCAGKIWDVFYVVAGRSNGIVKFGITSGDPRPRLSRHTSAGLGDVVRLIEGMPGDLAPQLERCVLAALRDVGERPVRGAEYFPAHALGLILDIVDGWTASLKPVKMSAA